jgi:hypothetical protein
MVGTCTKASLQVRLQLHIYDYSSKEDELQSPYWYDSLLQQLQLFLHDDE